MKLAAATAFLGAPTLFAPPTFFVPDFMKRAACALAPPASSACDRSYFRISLCDSGCSCGEGKDVSEEVRGSCRVGWGERGGEFMLLEAGILNSALWSSIEPSKV